MSTLPREFEELIRQQLGGEYPEFVSSLTQPAPVSIRQHPVKGDEMMGDRPVPWSQHGRYLGRRPVFTLDPLFHAGCYYVQEASSMFLEQAFTQAVDLRKPLNVLDLCAAPGGKSTHILSLLNRDSILISNETIRSRAMILSENIQKWGYPNCLVSNNDPADFKNLHGFFDVIVIDAPCSGEGLFRKDSTAIEEWSPQNVQLCSSRQRRIVSDVWDALREDGVLIYCTCTYNQNENEKNLEWLQQEHAVETIRLKIDSHWGIEEITTGKMFGYRFYPHRLKGEGFFLSILRRKESAPQMKIKSKKALSAPSKQISERLSSWMNAHGDANFFQFKDLLFYTPIEKAKDMEHLLQTLKIVYAGTNLATLKHDKLIPDHALALSVEVNKQNFPMMEVDEHTALSYLRRENLHLPVAPAGFTMLTYKNIPIGWVNVLSNRVNNMYPAEWRIRMAHKGPVSE